MFVVSLVVLGNTANEGIEMNAISFINRSSNDTKFDICIDGKWNYQNNKENAICVIAEYEFQMDLVAMEANGIVSEPWKAEIMEWFINYDCPNTVAIDIC